MTLTQLAGAIDRFAAAVVRLTDDQLDLPWAWRDYDSDGIRFAFFRILEELRGLAADLEREAGAAAPPTMAALLLRPYHAAFREMHALLLGIEQDDFEAIPAEGEWPLRRVIAHAVDADVGFYAVVSETLKALRAGDEPPRKPAEDIWDGIVGMPIADFDRMLERDVHGVLAFHHAHHARILAEFSAITDEEIESPSYYWEKSSYSSALPAGPLRIAPAPAQHPAGQDPRVRSADHPARASGCSCSCTQPWPRWRTSSAIYGVGTAKANALAEVVDAYTAEVQTAVA